MLEDNNASSKREILLMNQAEEKSVRVAEGTTYVCFHLSDSTTNVLTNDAWDSIAKTPKYKVSAIRMEEIS